TSPTPSGASGTARRRPDGSAWRDDAARASAGREETQLAHEGGEVPVVGAACQAALPELEDARPAERERLPGGGHPRHVALVRAAARPLGPSAGVAHEARPELEGAIRGDRHEAVDEIPD